MTYLLVLGGLLLFVLGLRSTKDLATGMADMAYRRSLMLRVAGFFAMATWVHALPALLALVYMRQEEFLAPEVFSLEDVRATVVGLYALPLVVLLVLLGSFGAIWSVVTGSPWRFFSVPTLGGVATCLVGVLGSSAAGDVVPSLFLATIVVPVTLYTTLTLTTPLAQQVRLYWMPFLVILLVSAAVLLAPAQTHKLVSRELTNFGTGGGIWVVVRVDDQTIEGELVLLTDRNVYVRGMLDAKMGSHCVIRIPTNRAVVATTYTTQLESAYIGLSEDDQRAVQAMFAIPDQRGIEAKRGAAAAESTRDICRETTTSADWARLRELGAVDKLGHIDHHAILRLLHDYRSSGGPRAHPKSHLILPLRSGAASSPADGTSAPNR